MRCQSLIGLTNRGVTADTQGSGISYSNYSHTSGQFPNAMPFAGALSLESYFSQNTGKISAYDEGNCCGEGKGMKGRYVGNTGNFQHFKWMHVQTLHTHPIFSGVEGPRGSSNIVPFPHSADWTDLRKVISHRFPYKPDHYKAQVSLSVASLHRQLPLQCLRDRALPALRNRLPKVENQGES